MSCEGLMKRLGFDCRIVGEKTVAVGTPFAFADGEPIHFYIDEEEDLISLSDNADTIFHLGSIGMDVSDKRTWKGVKQIVSIFGFELHDSGEIVGKIHQSAEQTLITKYISAMLAVADLEREYLGVPEEEETYVQEVEMYLKAWKPNVECSRYASATGHSGRLHRFDFGFDDKLIDAAKPHSNRTGSILRKAIDIKNGGIETEIMVIMDDREDTERANIEMDILSATVSVLPFTRLAGLSSGNLIPV